MSIASLEKDLVANAIAVSGDKTLTRKRLVEWTTGDHGPLQDGDVVIKLNGNCAGITCVFEPKKKPVKAS